MSLTTIYKSLKIFSLSVIYLLYAKEKYAQ